MKPQSDPHSSTCDRGTTAELNQTVDWENQDALCETLTGVLGQLVMETRATGMMWPPHMDKAAGEKAGLHTAPRLSSVSTHQILFTFQCTVRFSIHPGRFGLFTDFPSTVLDHFLSDAAARHPSMQSSKDEIWPPAGELSLSSHHLYPSNKRLINLSVDWWHILIIKLWSSDKVPLTLLCGWRSYKEWLL